MQFFNSFGVIVQDGFYIHQYSNNLVLFENVKKIKMIKTRSYNLNILFTIIAVVVLAYFIVCNDQKSILILSGYLLSLFSFFVGFFYKKYNYKLVVLNKNRNSFIINVDSKIKDEAKKLLIEINKRIKLLENINNLEKEQKLLKAKRAQKTLRNSISTEMKKESELVLN